MHRVTVTLDDGLLEALDRMVAERGYQNRSEAIRDLADLRLNRTQHCRLDSGRDDAAEPSEHPQTGKGGEFDFEDMPDDRRHQILGATSSVAAMRNSAPSYTAEAATKLASAIVRRRGARRLRPAQQFLVQDVVIGHRVGIVGSQRRVGRRGFSAHILVGCRRSFGC